MKGIQGNRVTALLLALVLTLSLTPATLAAGLEEGASITLDKTKLDLTTGTTEELTATVEEKSATEITWKSDNSNVVTVEPKQGENSATVKAVGVGTATVTAQLGEEENAPKATCQVNVTWPDIRMNETELILEAGYSETLEVIFTPPTASAPAVSYTHLTLPTILRV